MISDYIYLVIQTLVCTLTALDFNDLGMCTQRNVGAFKVTLNVFNPLTSGYINSYYRTWLLYVPDI